MKKFLEIMDKVSDEAMMAWALIIAIGVCTIGGVF